MTAAAGPTRLVIIGATGRMGTSLVRALGQFPQLQLHAAIAAASNPALGRDSGELAGTAANGVLVSAGLEPALREAGLALDFSAATGSAGTVRACAAAGVALLLGTTGLGPEMPPILERAARQIPLLVAANTSLGGSLLLELVQRAAMVLGEEYDIQIQDVHHRSKLDAPSGTALALGAAARAGRGAGTAVGHASLRGGDVVGEHEVHFLGPGERILLHHSATDRSVFVRGALRAGCWLVRQGPGAYGMSDLQGEK